jgi:hypothetical protein
MSWTGNPVPMAPPPLDTEIGPGMIGGKRESAVRTFSGTALKNPGLGSPTIPPRMLRGCFRGEIILPAEILTLRITAM